MEMQLFASLLTIECSAGDIYLSMKVLKDMSVDSGAIYVSFVVPGALILAVQFTLF
jgi:hypothetical protein